jgi:uncharacterized cupredoxin-like copper-binding protein
MTGTRPPPARAGSAGAAANDPGAAPDLGRLGLRIGVLAIAIAGLGLVGAAVGTAAPRDVTIEIHYSRFTPAEVVVARGTAVTFVLRNTEPSDHEWIVGDAASHERHRTGTEPAHGARPTEISIPAGATRTTTIEFDEPGSLAFICHLPGHEAYGMVGAVLVR